SVRKPVSISTVTAIPGVKLARLLAGRCSCCVVKRRQLPSFKRSLRISRGLPPHSLPSHDGSRQLIPNRGADRIPDAEPRRYARGLWPYVPSAPRRTDTRRPSRRVSPSSPCCAGVRQTASPHQGLLPRR